MSTVPPLQSASAAVVPDRGPSIAPPLQTLLDQVEITGSGPERDLGRSMRALFVTPAEPSSPARGLAKLGPAALQHGAMQVLAGMTSAPVGQALVVVAHQVLPLLDTSQQREVAERLLPFDATAKPEGADKIHWAPMPAGTKLGNGAFTIKQPLSAGSFGAAYLAESSSGTPVVIKELLENDDHGQPVTGDARKVREDMFEIENRILMSMHLDCAPRGYGLVREGERTFLVMGALPGQSMAQAAGWTPQDEKLAGGLPRVAPERVLKWGLQLAGMLQEVHTEGTFPIIHKDLRPQNAMVDDKGEAEGLIDFGLSKAVATEQAFGGRTELNPYSGSYGYLPLEQYPPQSVAESFGPDFVTHLGPPDARSDIHALGMTLYALLTGVNPEKAEGLRTPQYSLAFAQDEHGQYPNMVGVPLELRPIIGKMTKALPEERYQSAAEVQKALQGVHHLTPG